MSLNRNRLNNATYEEKEYSKLEEIDSTYTTVKEREEERAKVQNEDEIDR